MAEGYTWYNEVVINRYPELSEFFLRGTCRSLKRNDLKGITDETDRERPPQGDLPACSRFGSCYSDIGMRSFAGTGIRTRR